MLHPNIRFLHNLEGLYCDKKYIPDSYLLTIVWFAKVEFFYCYFFAEARCFFLSSSFSLEGWVTPQATKN